MSNAAPGPGLGTSLQPWQNARAGVLQWRLNMAWFAGQNPTWLPTPEQLVQPPAQALTKERPGKHTSVFRAPLPDDGRTTVIVKRYRPNHAWDTWRSLVRRSPARRAFERAYALRQLDIPTAMPIAAGERRCCGFLRESWLVLEDVPGATTWRQLMVPEADSRFRRACVRQLAQILARLHNAGLAHTDTTLGNFLVRGDGAPAWQLVAIDLDGIRPAFRNSMRGILRDLRIAWRRIPMSRRERLWFCAAYGHARSLPFSARELIQRLPPIGSSVPQNALRLR